MATTCNTVRGNGLVVRAEWDSSHSGPVSVLITLDHAYFNQKGITESSTRGLLAQCVNPDTLNTIGTLRGVGDWLLGNRPAFRRRPEDSNSWYAHVALFYVLALQAGERDVPTVLAHYAGVKPRMARTWIEGARKRCFLTGSTDPRAMGKGYGSLTDKARAVLVEWSTGQEEVAA